MRLDPIATELNPHQRQWAQWHGRWGIPLATFRQQIRGLGNIGYDKTGMQFRPAPLSQEPLSPDELMVEPLSARMVPNLRGMDYLTAL